MVDCKGSCIWKVALSLVSAVAGVRVGGLHLIVDWVRARASDSGGRGGPREVWEILIWGEGTLPRGEPE